MKRLLMLCASLALACVCHAAYPDRPLKLVVSFPAGSTSDFVARLVSIEMAKQLGQPIVVENKEGAQTVIGMRYALTAPADGYTMVLFGSTPASINVSMFKNLPYDPVKDFTPIGLVGESPLIMVSALPLPVRNIGELIDYGRAHPGKLTFGHSSTATQVAAASFAQQGRIEALPVAYRGTPQVLIDLMSGQIDAALLDYPFALANIRAGKVRPLGVTSKTAFPLSPDIPPVADALPGYELKVFFGFAAPGNNLPAEVVQKLSDALAAALKNETVARRLAEQGIVARATTPAEFGAYVKNDIQFWARLIQAAGIKPQD